MSSKQHKVEIAQNLLDENGNIAEAGYSTSCIWQYSRNQIKAKKSRIKEWDYYLIADKDYALALTLADNGYLGAISASVIDFNAVRQVTKSSATFFPMGKLNFPTSPETGNVSHRNGKTAFTFSIDENKTRTLKGKYKGFSRGDLDFEVILTDSPKEYMAIATPFKEPTYFYYNAKLNCMTARGKFTFEGKTHTFDESALATLDWGRGVWTYDNTWYWASLQTTLKNGTKFGFNLGYGFGDTTAATENMLFYDGKAHKIENVLFNIPKVKGRYDYLNKWTFTSSDGRLELDFKPVIDRYAPVNLGFFMMIPHQVFGKFSGFAILDDGERVNLNDVMGFAERVHNKW